MVRSAAISCPFSFIWIIMGLKTILNASTNGKSTACSKLPVNIKQLYMKNIFKEEINREKYLRKIEIFKEEKKNNNAKI